MLTLKNTLLLIASTLFATWVWAESMEKLEPLYAVQFSDQQLLIKVKSHGCTKAEHFTVKQTEKNDKVQLAIVRTQSDQCRTMPHIVDIKLPFSAESDTLYSIDNPLAFSKSQ